mmetsp:Transcript_11040/g.33268  ORF Transcript_11040/g.33268 Transcript_11040/m.33268 type:complete len:247 (-) Transcript_11040:71-811(-)
MRGRAAPPTTRTSSPRPSGRPSGAACSTMRGSASTGRPWPPSLLTPSSSCSAWAPPSPHSWRRAGAGAPACSWRCPRGLPGSQRTSSRRTACPSRWRPSPRAWTRRSRWRAPCSSTSRPARGTSSSSRSALRTTCSPTAWSPPPWPRTPRPSRAPRGRRCSTSPRRPSSSPRQWRYGRRGSGTSTSAPSTPSGTPPRTTRRTSGGGASGWTTSRACGLRSWGPPRPCAASTSTGPRRSPWTRSGGR